MPRSGFCSQRFVVPGVGLEGSAKPFEVFEVCFSVLTVLDCGQKEVHVGELTPFAARTTRASLLCSACPQVAVPSQDPDPLPGRGQRCRILPSPGPTSHHTAAQVCPHPRPDSVLTSLQALPLVLTLAPSLYRNPSQCHSPAGPTLLPRILPRAL